MVPLTDPDYAKRYERLKTFVCMQAEDRLFIIGKCATMRFDNRMAGDTYNVPVMNRQSLVSHSIDEPINRYTRYDRLEFIICDVVDPEERSMHLGLLTDQLEKALCLPQFMLNLSLTQEMIDAWREMLRDETQHLNLEIARLQAEIRELNRPDTRPKNRMGRRVKPQRRINLGE